MIFFHNPDEDRCEITINGEKHILGNADYIENENRQPVSEQPTADDEQELIGSNTEAIDDIAPYDELREKANTANTLNDEDDEKARAILEALQSLEEGEKLNNSRIQMLKVQSRQPKVNNKPSTNAYNEGEEPIIIEADKERLVNKLATESKKTQYRFPKLDFLAKPSGNSGIDRTEMLEKSKKLENTLSIFGIDAKVNNISQGPAITRYELALPEGVKVSRIESLENDIMLALAANSIRMEVPIPGKSDIGIEIPNDSVRAVPFSEILMSEKFNSFKSKLAFGLGKDITGNVIVSDIAKMPHLLIAGATGSGKSVCVNTMLTSILYKANSDEVKLILIDPKVVELSVYNGIPHLLIPVVTDPHKAAGALSWAAREMMRRYRLFASTGTRKLEGYNEKMPEGEKLPQILVVIDELADLMIAAKKEVENSIQRLTQLARAAGIHLIIATQRPSVDIITGVIKANVPSRIAFKVSSSTDSRTILDASGADKLLGKGDMLLKTVDMDKPLRIQGAFVSDDEVERIVNYIKVDDSHYDNDIIQALDRAAEDSGASDSFTQSEEGDSLINEVISFVVHSKKASISAIQRKFRIGYNKAANYMDELEERGIVGPDIGGTKGREVLMDKYELNEWLERQQRI